MLKKILTAVACAAMLSLHAGNAPKWVEKAFKAAERQSADMYVKVCEHGKLPRSIERGLQGPEDWTAGFFPGVMWNLYEHTGDTVWQHRAEYACTLLEGQQFNAHDHDIGFKMQCSLGRGLELTGNPEYPRKLYRSARHPRIAL